MVLPSETYPGLYVASDAASTQAQSRLASLLKLNFLFLISAAALTLFSQKSLWSAWLSLLFFSASLGIYMYGKIGNFQNVWYQGRALAESVKTMVWRYMMEAPPFDRGEDVDAKFARLLSELVAENSGLGSNLASSNGVGSAITSGMRQVRRCRLEERRRLYMADRVVEQREWYERKALSNKRMGGFWLFAVIALHAIAMVLMIWRISDPKIDYLPIEVVVVGASCVITWTQFRKFDELASAYTLAAIEIGIIEVEGGRISSVQQLSDFVGNAENAFSREHTQWLARKDLGS